MAESDAGTGSDADPSGDADEPPYRVALAPLFERVESLEADVREFEAAIAGGLAGGFQAALVIQLYDTDAIRRVGAIVGAPTLDGGWLAMLALGVLFALPFRPVVSRTIDGFVSSITTLSRRNDAVRAVLVPLLRRSAFTTTMVGLGSGYGVAVGVLVSLFASPLWLSVATEQPAVVPDVTASGLVGVVAWTVYGGTLGLVYGSILEH
ncbi:hypothetical protein [Natrinema salaciae]|uniref:Uncharacterized protein n=1 Tax=Natrinema salaciae TaxID=1186196 RepID=A0A1H9LCJ1_9EURY|nr:hypothetical protein [Natrinema salaciae]SER09156.1 hypothetical protein SAMN04489841_2923 [Natrinema salaciae]